MANDFSGDSNCVALWKFNSGALTTDSKGGNTLTDNNTVGANTSTHKEGDGCASFTASNSEYFNITDANLDSGYPFKTGDSNLKFSICFWFYADTTHDGAFYSKYDNGTRTIALRYSSSNQFLIYFGYNSGASYETVAATTSLSPGSWFHVGFTYDDSDRSWKLRLYDEADTEERDYSGTASNNISVMGSDVTIGRRFATNYFNGDIDEMVVFNDVLTNAEITEIRSGTYSAGGDTAVTPFSTVHNHFAKPPQIFKAAYLNILSTVHKNATEISDAKVDRGLFIKGAVHADYVTVLQLLAGRSLFIKSTIHDLLSPKIDPKRDRGVGIKNTIHDLLSPKIDPKRDRGLAIKKAVHDNFVEIVGLLIPGFVSVIPKDAIHGLYSDILNTSTAFKLNPFSTVHEHNAEIEILSLLRSLTILDTVHGLYSDGTVSKDIVDIILSVRDSIHDNLLNTVSLKRNRIADIKSAVHELCSNKITLQAAIQLLILDSVHELAAGKCIFTVGERYSLYNFVAKNSAYVFNSDDTAYNFIAKNKTYKFDFEV